MAEMTFPGNTEGQIAVSNPADLARYLETGGNPDLADSDGRTLLHLSAGAGDIESLQLLVRSGADLSRLDRYGLSVAHAAEETGCLPVLRFLIEACGVSPDSASPNGWSLLHSASERGHEETVVYLLSRGAQALCFNEAGSTPLHYACSGGALPVVEWLCGHGADCHSKEAGGETPLDVAVRKRFAGGAEFLRKRME